MCVAPCEGGWYRCQVVAYDEDTQVCDIKYLDYGGYHSIAATELKQIRTDFLSLPFQVNIDLIIQENFQICLLLSHLLLSHLSQI